MIRTIFKNIASIGISKRTLCRSDEASATTDQGTEPVIESLIKSVTKLTKERFFYGANGAFIRSTSHFVL